MKKYLLSIIIIICCTIVVNAQVLLRNNQGEQFFSYNQNAQGTLLNVNTANSSLGIDYFFNDKAQNPSNYHIFRIGISSRATDGLSSLLKQGQFSPGANINATYTKIGLFSAGKTSHSFDDWLDIRSGYTTDKFKIFKSDTTFKDQLSTPRFDSFNLGFTYNVALGLEAQHYLSLSFGVSRKSNYSDLTSIEIQDYKTTNDLSGITERRYGSTQTAKAGPLKIYDSYPLVFSYTHLPRYQRMYNKDSKGNDLEKEKVTRSTQILQSKGRVDTIIHIVKDKQGKEIKTQEYVIYKGKIDTVNTSSIEKVKVENPFYKSLKLGYAIYLNSDINNTNSPTQTILGSTIFFVSPNKDNIITSRIGLTAEIKDFFDVQKINNGPLKRLNIGLTVNFSL